MSLNQCETPLLDALIRHSRRRAACLHVPGHRRGAGLPLGLKELAGELPALDLTELPGLDNLHCPHGAIAAAQELAAQLFGARWTYFLVNGTTCGIAALILATCGEGRRLAVPRNAHRSVLGGLILSGAEPVYLYPTVIPEFSVAAGVSAGELSGMLGREASLDLILLVNPTYYGVSGNLRELVELAHAVGITVVVDEAHGTHLRFHDALPGDAMSAGADASVQSVHKTGGALTQASLLHVGSSRVSPGRLAAALRILETSSPSYILMASLDAARQQLACRGREMLERAVELSRWTRRQLERVPGLEVLSEEYLDGDGAFALDLTRLVISVRGLDLSGHQVAGLLHDRYHVDVEMADAVNLVAVISLGTQPEDCRALVNALSDIAARWPGSRVKGGPELPAFPPPARVRVTPRRAWLSPARPVPLREACGAVSAETVEIYPPGVPVLCPGEEITREVIEYLEVARFLNLNLCGAEDPALTTIRVVDL